MAVEISNLLSHAALEASSCGSEQLSPRRPTSALASTSLPQKQGSLLPSANTSSQASLDEGEASLDDIPPNISPIAAICGVSSISPSMELAKL